MDKGVDPPRPRLAQELELGTRQLVRLRTPARIASSMSWLMYATRSTIRTILPSSVSGESGPVWWRIPSLTSSVRFRPWPSFSSTSTIRSECSLWWNLRPKRSCNCASSASSPVWPNGGCPRSWPRPIASTRSSFRPSARATPREIPVVSSVCVMRVRKWSPPGSMKTCVLFLQPAESLRVDDAVAVALERRSQTARLLSRARPRDSYERTASGESQRSSCSRTRASKASATRPASSVIRPPRLVPHPAAAKCPAWTHPPSPHPPGVWRGIVTLRHSGARV